MRKCAEDSTANMLFYFLPVAWFPSSYGASSCLVHHAILSPRFWLLTTSPPDTFVRRQRHDSSIDDLQSYLESLVSGCSPDKMKCHRPIVRFVHPKVIRRLKLATMQPKPTTVVDSRLDSRPPVDDSRNRRYIFLMIFYFVGH